MEHYLVAMAITAGLYALMAFGTNVFWGMAGLVNLGVVGFVGVGAYTSALLTLKLGWPIPLGMLAGAVMAALAGILVGMITVNLRGDYLAIVTLGFAETVRIFTSNEIWLANGTDGLSGIPGPWRSDLGPHGFNLLYLAIVVVVVVIAFFVAERLCYSPFGRVLRALRDDEQVASVAGKYVLLFKLKAFAIGTGALGLAGALYAHFTSYIAPDLFVPLLTLYIKLSLLVGGLGNNKGALIGAISVVFFLESTRFVVPLIGGLSAVQGAALRELIVSGALLLILRYHTRGMVPERIVHPALPGEPAAPSSVQKPTGAKT